VIAALAAALLAAHPGQAATAARPAPDPVAAGRYLLQGTARLDAPGLPADEQPVEALALVAPGASRGDVLLHLRARGYACDLRARLAASGALHLAPGQVCRVAVDDADTIGRIDARLRQGEGSLRGDELALRLAWDLAGSLRTRVSIPGAGDDAPSAWTPELAVRGDAEGEVRGRRDPPPASPRPAARGR
jgi:hypothetical protein